MQGLARPRDRLVLSIQRWWRLSLLAAVMGMFLGGGTGFTVGLAFRDGVNPIRRETIEVYPADDLIVAALMDDICDDGAHSAPTMTVWYLLDALGKKDRAAP